MYYWQYSYRLFFHFAAAILILTGCAPEIQKPMQVCPGKKTVSEALSVLRSRSQNEVPLKANGQCRLEYYTDGKPKKENFPVRLWLNPPAEIYLRGDVAFDPKGIVLGSNENEFWLAIRLKEISSYWWGRWKETSQIDELIISPRLVLEALGIAAVGSEKTGAENWSLSKEGLYDVLTRRNGNGRIIKKIYIYNCDYSVRKIECFAVNGQAKVIVELDKYKQVVEGFFVPRIIKIVNSEESVRDSDSIIIRLTTVKSDSFSEKKRNLLFKRPETDRFKHVYINIGGKWIEQQ